jgi:hypothetical protein
MMGYSRSRLPAMGYHKGPAPFNAVLIMGQFMRFAFAANWRPLLT